MNITDCGQWWLLFAHFVELMLEHSDICLAVHPFIIQFINIIIIISYCFEPVIALPPLHKQIKVMKWNVVKLTVTGRVFNITPLLADDPRCTPPHFPFGVSLPPPHVEPPERRQRLSQWAGEQGGCSHSSASLCLAGDLAPFPATASHLDLI